MKEKEYLENVGKVVEAEPIDRIEEIKAYSKKGIDYREDVPFLIGEIDRLKMMLDAAAAGQETMQKQWAADIDRLTAERVEVVRCKDCRHRGEPICPMDDFIASEELQDDWFCNCGVRREPEGR